MRLSHRSRNWIQGLLVCCWSAGGLCAGNGDFDFVRDTHLLELTQGSELSRKVSSLRTGSFETSGGRLVSFDKWYATRWVDARVSFITQISPTFGVIWGFSTGEKGEKYSIEPSIKTGFLLRHPLSKQSAFTLHATTIIGGRLKEHACSADYGDIGGVQEVNCRLAATSLEPSKTLSYLLNQRPYNQTVAWVRYSLDF